MKAETGRTDSGGRLKSFTWTKADGGQTLSVCPKDGFGRRTVKVFSKRTETDGGQIPLVRLKDGFGRRTLKKISKKRTEEERFYANCGSHK